MMRNARGHECIRVRVHAHDRVHAGGRECVRARVHAVIVTVAVNVRGHDHVHTTYANHECLSPDTATSARC